MKHDDRIAGFIESEKILLSHHARARMFERNVYTDDLITMISSGEIIEEYRWGYAGRSPEKNCACARFPTVKCH